MIKVTKKLVEARHHAAMVGPDVEPSDIVAHDHQNVRFFAVAACAWAIALPIVKKSKRLKLPAPVFGYQLPDPSLILL